MLAIATPSVYEWERLNKKRYTGPLPVPACALAHNLAATPNPLDRPISSAWPLASTSSLAGYNANNSLALGPYIAAAAALYSSRFLASRIGGEVPISLAVHPTTRGTSFCSWASKIALGDFGKK